MRTHQTLPRWNTDRGFGCITPTQPGDDLFVHVSAFSRGAGAPRIGELISFEIEPGKDGRRQPAGTPHQESAVALLKTMRTDLLTGPCLPTVAGPYAAWMPRKS